MKKYKSPSLEVLSAPEEAFCAEDASVADNLNYKHLTDVTIDLDQLEEWDGN